MFVKLEAKHFSMMAEYLAVNDEAVIYLKKPFEQFVEGDSQGVFYGNFSGGIAGNPSCLTGIFYFSNKRVLALHCVEQKILAGLDLLKAIKYYKPKFVKGTSDMVQGVYRLICRAVAETFESQMTLMVYDDVCIDNLIPEGFSWVTGSDPSVDQLLSDLHFFIDVETHFGRQVKAINDIIKTFKCMILDENYLLVVKDGEIVGQGLIEDETSSSGVLAGIYVSNKYRRLRIGESISRKLTETLLVRGKKPYLFVKNNNNSARLLYEKIGYKVVKQYAVLTVTY